MRYYSEKLSAERLKRCYEIASPRVRQYLDAEVSHVLTKITDGDKILDLGCGYGRVLENLYSKTSRVYGIDTSISSLTMAKNNISKFPKCGLFMMDAVSSGFKDDIFDIVFCIQNGISVFNVDKLSLISESIRVTRPGGLVMFSSYSAKFWPYRLEWFEAQAKEGLLGEIDYEKTCDGKIVCKDGFKSTTVSADEFRTLVKRLNLKAEIIEVDESCLFCEISV